MAWDSEDTVFLVVMNHEEQYSIWPDYMDIPKGWRAVGMTGKKPECLAYIKEHWTDMRPLSLRKHMEAVKERQEKERLANEQFVKEMETKEQLAEEQHANGQLAEEQHANGQAANALRTNGPAEESLSSGSSS